MTSTLPILDHIMEARRQELERAVAAAAPGMKRAWQRALREHVAKMLEHERRAA